MNKKLILFSSLMIFVSLAVFVSADYFSTTSSTETYSQPGWITDNSYVVEYDITEPGWYLLPSSNGIVPWISIEKEVDYADFYGAADYRYRYSPFTNKYVRVGEGDDPLDYDFIGFYGLSEDNFRIISQETFSKDYLAYDVISADWHYYSKPVKVNYEYRPQSMIGFEEGDDEPGLMDAKLKKGWNMIIYPPYAAYGDVVLGDCNIEKLHIWMGALQEWDSSPDVSGEELTEIMTSIGNDGSGSGMAIKVTNDCTFLKEKELEGPPSIPS